MKPELSTKNGDSNQQTIIQMKGMTKKFGGLLAVNDVDFVVPQGQIRCLIGPNGAGKSTLLKLLTGIHPPTSGTIYFQGENITKMHPHERARKGISYMFQKSSLYTELTVEQNLRIPLQFYVRSDQLDSKSKDLLTLVGLNDKRTVPVKNLSHGEKQWLEIAMTMGVEPDLLLLDEPTAGMTPQETEETADLIYDLVSEGITILAVEHDVNFVREIADLITVMHSGEIFAEGTAEEIMNNEEVKRIYLGKSAEEE